MKYNLNWIAIDKQIGRCYTQDVTLSLRGEYHVENKNREASKNKMVRECGVCTCIHCVINSCTLDECEMYEVKLLQEG